MPDVNNSFIKGIMDSDTHYSLLDNKSFVLLENGRISGDGDDGAIKNLMGSEIVSDYSENGTMTVIGIHRGKDNKLFYFTASPNGKSKIIEYDADTKVSRLIIEDNTVLRFDLVRWNSGVEIFPYKYILSFNQIGDLLIFSNEVWENVRCVNLKRLSDYAGGFSETDIALAKQPPLKEPEIIDLYWDSTIADSTQKDKFVSFAYRYKYKDGDWSALSFYSDVAFEMNGHKEGESSDVPIGFKINAERLNEGMTNRYNAVKLLINSGGENVTDIQVIAREHNTNIAYIIYDANKEKVGIPNNTDSLVSPFAPIVYKFSTNYKVLSDDAVKLIYSGLPKFPKTQDVAGSRLIIANYFEGYDLKDINGEDILVDFDLRKDTLPANIQENNTTAVSLFSYKVGLEYLDNNNVSTTVLENVKQEENEISVPFADRTVRNIIKAKINNNPPSFATKFKFVVKAEELNYELLYITYGKKIGQKLYLLLNGDNVNRVNKSDILTRIDSSALTKDDYLVTDVKTLSIDDGLPIKGLYAQIEVPSNFTLTSSGLPDVTKKREKYWEVFDSVYGTSNPERFDATSGYQGTYDGNYYTSLANRGAIIKSDYGNILEGDTLSINLTLNYGRDKKGRGEDAIDIFGAIDISETIYASKNYANVYDFLLDEFINAFINLDNPSNGNEVRFLTNSFYPDLVKEKVPSAYGWQSNSGNRDERAVVKVTTNTSLKRGIKPIIFRTQNDEVLNEFYFETPKTYDIINGQHIGAEPDGYFDVGFFNGYAWGNGIESYKIKDAFNGKKLNFNFRGNQISDIDYKRIHRKNDITYGGVYNYELGLNQLSWFEYAEANWKTLPIKYGEIQRIIATDGDITVFQNDKVVNQYYGKSIIADAQGNESLALINDVLGAYKELDYEVGCSENPESIVKSGNLIYFTDKSRSRIHIKGGQEIQEINPPRCGTHKESVDLLKDHKSFLGSFNEARGEYSVGIDHQFSLVFNPSNKGFTNYFTNDFQYNFGMSGSSFTAYKGRLYENEVTTDYGNIAGQPQNFKLKYVVNPEVDSDKIFKAMFLQSNVPFDTKIRTNLTESTIPKNFYTQKESFFYTEILRNTGGDGFFIGIGNVKGIIGNTIQFSSKVGNSISIGDYIATSINPTELLITDINGDLVTLSDASSISIGQFVFAIKKNEPNFNPDGAPIRGKWMEVALENDINEPIEITSATTNLIKSYL